MKFKVGAVLFINGASCSIYKGNKMDLDSWSSSLYKWVLQLAIASWSSSLYKGSNFTVGAQHIYQHFQDCEKIHEIDPCIEYSLFENVIDSYYLDSQIRGDFTCTRACYTSTQCAFNIIPLNLEAENQTEKTSQNNTGIHFHSKHKYRDTFGDAHVHYHDFDNSDDSTVLL